MRRPLPGAVRFLGPVLLLATGCLRDPDIAKITCRNDEGCPVGYVCTVTNRCCRSSNGATCDNADAALETASPVDGATADSRGQPSESGQAYDGLAGIDLGRETGGGDVTSGIDLPTPDVPLMSDTDVGLGGSVGLHAGLS